MYSKELELAKRLADIASTITMTYFRQQPKAFTKEDMTPVTVADREAEKAMRALIEKTFPKHGILGEEFEDRNINAKYVWTLDPIDGTKSFITGMPLFGTLVSLLRDGVPIIGIIDMPALNERWVGCEGRSTLFNGRSAQVRSCSDIGEAWLYATSPHMFLGNDFKAKSNLEYDIENLSTFTLREQTPNERLEFIEQLSSKQFKQVERFFATMPKLSHTIEVTNPNTKKKSKIVLEGLSDFFG